MGQVIRDSGQHEHAKRTWNDPARIRVHRELSPDERLRLTIEASRSALRFAEGKRRMNA
jgi:hypothetical protein